MKQSDNLVELEPLMIGRIENAFDFGFSNGRKRGVGKVEVEVLEHRFRPLITELGLENQTAGSKPMKTEKLGFPRSGTTLASHVVLGFSCRFGNQSLVLVRVVVPVSSASAGGGEFKRDGFEGNDVVLGLGSWNGNGLKGKGNK